jgi:hypothetical protein
MPVSVWLQLMALSCLVLCISAVVTSHDRSGQTVMITLASNSSLDIMRVCVGFSEVPLCFHATAVTFPKAWGHTLYPVEFS